MSDKAKIEKLLQNFIASEKEAAESYLSQVCASKMKKIVNEDDNKEMNGSKTEVKELKGVGDTKAKPFKKVNTKVTSKNKPKGE